MKKALLYFCLFGIYIGLRRQFQRPRRLNSDPVYGGYQALTKGRVSPLRLRSQMTRPPREFTWAWRAVVKAQSPAQPHAVTYNAGSASGTAVITADFCNRHYENIHTDDNRHCSSGNHKTTLPGGVRRPQRIARRSRRLAAPER